MSGHSKWHNIQARKSKSDAQRGKIFTKIGREIAVAVKEGGPDPNSNNKLKDIISKAKTNNMPNDSIIRAIKKASGELGLINYETITYEGYGVGGSAVIVECLTDNKNRTAGDVRHAFDKYNGSLGSNGCVGYMFKRFGVVVIEKSDKIDADELMMQALDLGALDINEDDESYQIFTKPDEHNQISEALEKLGFVIADNSVDMIPDIYVELDEKQQATFEKMIEILEESDDVQEIYHNVK